MRDSAQYLLALALTRPTARAVAVFGLVVMACSPAAERSPEPGQEQTAVRLAEAGSLATSGWSPAAPMSQPRAVHTATLLQDGRLLIVGGYSRSTDTTSSAELYDPVTQAWSTTGALSVARDHHTATLLRDGTVLVTGGTRSISNPSVFISSSEVYDPATGTWSGAGSLRDGRSGHTATLLHNGKVLVTGGNNSGSCEVYDPTTRTWSAAGSLGEALSGHTATLLHDGTVLMVGAGTIHSEVYDPATGISSPLKGPPGASSRVGHTATLLPDGTVLVTGGKPFNSNDPNVFLSSSEVYDPATHTWSGAGSLGGNRSGHTATLLPNGAVLVVGGASYYWLYCNSSTEVYVPSTRQWLPSARLPEARCAQSATVLDSGQVAIAGGQRVEGFKDPITDLSSVWLFSPQELKTRFSAVPANPTNQTPATFAFSTSETGAGFECSLDEAAFQPCTSPWMTPSLSEGSHSMYVRARDAEGNVDEIPATYFWTVDTVPPGASFASTPEPETRLSIPAFSFSATEPRVTFECSLDGAPFAECSDGFPSLNDGPHQLAVRARDEAGNVGSPAGYSWKVDTVKPEPPVLQEPTPGQEFFSTRPRFLGTAEPGATVALLVDGLEVGSVRADAQGAWSAVPGSALSLGEHRVSVRATDGADNSSGSIPEVPFFTSRRGNYRLGCAASPSSWQASWPWALLLLGLLRPRARQTVLPARAVAALGLVHMACGPVAERSSTLDPERAAVSFAQGAILDSPGWSPVFPLKQAREGHTATLLRDGTVLVVGGYMLVAGGYSPSGVHASSEVYDPGTRTWSSAGSLQETRSGHTATLLPDGRVLVTGGSSSGSCCEVYDPATRTWSSAGSLQEARFGRTATLLPNGRVLVVGGAVGKVYDPATDSWSFTRPPLNSYGGGYTATLLPNGKVLFVGAATERVPYLLKDSELYDPATDTWSAAGQLNDYRSQHTATLLPNGKVLVVGGQGPFGYVNQSTEVYDPSSNQWHLDATLSESRFQHSATLLDSGQVLVAGGHIMNFDGPGKTLSSAELWTPPLDTEPPETVDTVPPGEPALLEPAPGQTLLTDRPVFSGRAEPDSTVTLLVDGVEVSSARTDAQGVWSGVPSAALSWGAHRASALATDRAGNPGPPLPEVRFSTSRRGNYRLGCAANASSWQASWPWALLLFGLLRPRSRPLR
ncbi:kelch repeat-containing protein [Hyalangium sp.]|uniref:kelch repeat-containing protein n=1 Tax=Hyalangium sp. TaxID=2028555 RepID=UPI002D3F2063|nr:kelch repeat-containing protein [Hyalangium sp.]HYH95367.1 kelch repeat-containing protein [Hyalangium sp.]